MNFEKIPDDLSLILERKLVTLKKRPGVERHE